MYHSVSFGKTMYLRKNKMDSCADGQPNCSFLYLQKSVKKQGKTLKLNQKLLDCIQGAHWALKPSLILLQIAMIFQLQLEFVDIIFRSNFFMCKLSAFKWPLLTDDNWETLFCCLWSQFLKQGHIFSPKALLPSCI